MPFPRPSTGVSRNQIYPDDTDEDDEDQSDHYDNENEEEGEEEVVLPSTEELKQAVISPAALTDKELISFAERYLDTGMPLNFQKELIKRLAQRINW